LPTCGNRYGIKTRAVKDAIGAKFNCDLRALFEEIKRAEAELQVKEISLIPPPIDPASLPNSTLRGLASLTAELCV
jgi:hypothetical protein